MEFEFEGEIWYWRGPSPFHFVTVPEERCMQIEAMAPAVSYGWGMIPATVRIGKTNWYTALWPKDGHYIVPLKAAIRKTEKLNLGDVVSVRLTIDA